MDISRPTFSVQRVRWSVCLGYIDNSVDIERDLFAVCGPVFVTETINEFAVHFRIEGVVAGRD
jgi:hypothetical protein